MAEPQPEERVPAEGLRAVASTRHSVTVRWILSDESGQQRQGRDGTQTEVKAEGRSRSPYLLQIKDRILGWTTVYSGFGCEVEVTGLRPGDCFQFRGKKVLDGEDNEWSDTLFAATKGMLWASPTLQTDEVVPVGELFRAVQNGNATSAKRIIHQRPSVLNLPNKFSQTPLELAISNNDTNMVALLVNNGADVCGTEIGSWRTPLMIAAYRGHLEIAKLLLEKGSSWKERDRNGMTALHYAADNSHLEIVRLAVEGGADVNARDANGWSPLMRAVTVQASAEVIRFLLENGGDVNETDPREQTLLMQAVISGKPEIVRFFLAKNADPGKKNAYGHTAYQMAAASTHKDVQRLAALLGGETDERGGCGGRRRRPQL